MHLEAASIDKDDRVYTVLTIASPSLGCNEVLLEKTLPKRCYIVLLAVIFYNSGKMSTYKIIFSVISTLESVIVYISTEVEIILSARSPDVKFSTMT